MILRNVDLTKSVPASALVDILDAFVEEMSDKTALLESNRYIGRGKWEEATPDDIYNNVQDRVSELRDAILSEVPL